MSPGSTARALPDNLKKTRYITLLCLLLATVSAFAQSGINRFLTPADTINKPRSLGVGITLGVLAGGSIAMLDQSWYSDYEKSDFHTVNDNAEWLQMDKVGHVFSSYHLGRLGKEALQWSGSKRRDQLIYGPGMGFLYLTAVEIMDGYSSNWGFSYGDMAANFGGTALYVGQELLWKEQRITPKFSFHTTEYASARPNVLGENLPEQILKDYNGQTYWLSVNMYSFFKGSKIPKWLNLAVGYGAEGMVTGQDALVNTVFLPESERVRQFYFSFDADLTKIETRSHVLKTLFSVFNTVKIPAPTLEFRDDGIVKLRYLHF
jgi:hypothetical protein